VVRLIEQNRNQAIVYKGRPFSHKKSSKIVASIWFSLIFGISGEFAHPRNRLALSMTVSEKPVAMTSTRSYITE
jgi:hypothetical protein